VNVDICARKTAHGGRSDTSKSEESTNLLTRSQAHEAHDSARNEVAAYPSF